MFWVMLKLKNQRIWNNHFKMVTSFISFEFFGLQMITTKWLVEQIWNLVCKLILQINIKVKFVDEVDLFKCFKMSANLNNSLAS